MVAGSSCSFGIADALARRGILGGNNPLSPSGVNDDLDALRVYGLMANGNYVRIAARPSRTMTADEVKSTVQEYRIGAINAIRAGCDGACC
jgi:N-ethylmaleimide reductase